jgi:hypothetical protein
VSEVIRARDRLEPCMPAGWRPLAVAPVLPVGFRLGVALGVGDDQRVLTGSPVGEPPLARILRELAQEPHGPAAPTLGCLFRQVQLRARQARALSVLS